MTTLDEYSIEKLTALQIKTLEDNQRRVSDQVWNKCLREGREAFVSDCKDYRMPSYNNRDMSAAWNLGWFYMMREQQIQSEHEKKDRKEAQMPVQKKKSK